MIIENQRIETSDKMNSTNPATLETIGKFSLASSIECNNAVQAAKNAFPLWKTYSASEKRKIFAKAKSILVTRSQEVADTITREKGSPLTESLATEVFGSLEMLDYYISNSRNTLKPKRAEHHVFLFYHKKAQFHFQPLGPVLIVSPWNYPFIIPFYDIMSALASGNTVVFRPSTTTVFTALLIGEIFVDAGLPPGVLNIITCKTSQAEQMITSPDIQSIMFTGSTSVGKRIMELASRNLTNITLELGGKDPMIVCEDADLERAARGAVWGAFTNCGQSCGSVERAYVAEAVADEFTQRVLEYTKELKVGDPFKPDTDVGPMATFPQLTVVEDHIEDARENGADLLWGGDRIKNLPGYFIQPAVLANVNHSMKIMQEETFGPTLPIMTFSNPEEAVVLANDSDYGLTASVWTKNKQMATWMAEKIEAGTVTVNDHMTSFTEPCAIWGGIKQTGIGRSHGEYGLLELVNIKFINYDFARKKTLLWWFPYNKSARHLFEKAIDLYHHSKIKNKTRALFSLLSSLPEIAQKVPVRNFIKSLPRILKK